MIGTYRSAPLPVPALELMARIGHFIDDQKAREAEQSASDLARRNQEPEDSEVTDLLKKLLQQQGQRNADTEASAAMMPSTSMTVLRK